MTKNSNQGGGPALKLENVCLLFDCRSSPTAAACQSPSVHAATFWMEELRVPYAQAQLVGQQDLGAVTKMRACMTSYISATELWTRDENMAGNWYGRSQNTDRFRPGLAQERE